MDISCAFAPVPQTPEHVAVAERSGYRRAWVFDTPALQLDVWNLTFLNDLDRPVIRGETIEAFTFTGEAPALRARLDQLAAKGVTEIAYQPKGPDVARELTAFAAMADLKGPR